MCNPLVPWHRKQGGFVVPGVATPDNRTLQLYPPPPSAGKQQPLLMWRPAAEAWHLASQALTGQGLKMPTLAAGLESKIVSYEVLLSYPISASIKIKGDASELDPVPQPLHRPVV